MSTYKGKFGYVHYYVKALLERPQQPTLECKKSFDVEEPLDVNTPDLLVSFHSSQHHINNASALPTQSHSNLADPRLRSLSLQQVE